MDPHTSSGMALPGATAQRELSDSGLGPRVAHPVHLRWMALTLDVVDTLGKPKPGETEVPLKRVLHGVSGQVAPGQMSCIMGPSGSGKTSLLNVLARNIVAGVGGSVTINGAEPPAGFRRFLGYVFQDDDFIATLSVWETISFAARLKLPETLSQEARDMRCEEVLAELDLSHVKGSAVGVIGAGLSGGERRRLSIAVQMLNSPALLVADEPTSGLDSSSALMVVQSLRKLAKRSGCTVLCTLHQPRTSVLSYFDSVSLLSGGRTVYFGRPDEEMLGFFAAQGFPCPVHENPADYILDVVNTKDEMWAELAGAQAPAALEVTQLIPEEQDEAAVADLEAGAAERGPTAAPRATGAAAATVPSPAGPKDRRAEVVERLAGAYAASDVRERALALPPVMPPGLPSSGTHGSVYLTSWWNQTKVITHRSFLHKLREPAVAATQAVNAVLMSMLIGGVFFGQSETDRGANNVFSAVSLMAVLQAFFAYDIILLLPLERRQYLREQGSGIVSTSAYYIGRSAAEMPMHGLLAVVAATILYLMLGFRMEWDRYVVFMLMMVVLTLLGASFLLFVGSLCKSMDASNVLASSLLILMFIVDGRSIPVEDIPPVLRWLTHFSIMNYGVEIGATAFLKDVELGCSADQQIDGRCFYPNGNDVLRGQGMEDVNVGANFAVMIGMTVIYRVGAYLGLRFLHTGKTIRERLRE